MAYAWYNDILVMYGIIGVLVLANMFSILILILGAKWTYMLKELKARFKGRPLVFFFDDSRQFEMQVLPVDGGIISSDKYGAYLVNEKGSYIDKHTRNVVIPFNTSVAVGAPVSAFKITDSVLKIVQDEKKMSELRMQMARGDLEESEIIIPKESVNFSALKSVLNAINPHNLNAKISMEVANRLNSYGSGALAKQLMWFAIIGLGLIMFAALIMYLVMKGSVSTHTTTIKEVATPIITNASVVM